ncbi:MAG: hypothetical protein IJP26_00270, partial [Clostridia bacterium]|nr:hypothetical protein [Clostridia bacterium]
MLKNLKRIFALVLILSVCISSVGVSINAFADNNSQAILDEIERLNKESQALQKQINEKKASLKDQNAIKSSIEAQINTTQKKIDACNRYIEQCQAEIRESENKIAESNSKIESTKENFKKRIRSLYNSNSGSNVQVLLGAESFADFLTLSELSQKISAQDNKMVDELVTAISSIQEEIKKNEELKAKQAEIKKALAADRSVLDAQVADVNKVINQINTSKNNLQAEQNAMKAQMEAYENSLLYGSVSNAPFDGVFRWPVPGFPMTCPFMSNDSVHKGNHKGIDLGSWGINGKNIQCSATGVVTTLVNY